MEFGIFQKDGEFIVTTPTRSAILKSEKAAINWICKNLPGEWRIDYCTHGNNKFVNSVFFKNTATAFATKIALEKMRHVSQTKISKIA